MRISAYRHIPAGARKPLFDVPFPLLLVVLLCFACCSIRAAQAAQGEKSKGMTTELDCGSSATSEEPSTAGTTDGDKGAIGFRAAVRETCIDVSPREVESRQVVRGRLPSRVQPGVPCRGGKEEPLLVQPHTQWQPTSALPPSASTSPPCGKSSRSRKRCRPPSFPPPPPPTFPLVRTHIRGKPHIVPSPFLLRSDISLLPPPPLDTSASPLIQASPETHPTGLPQSFQPLRVAGSEFLQRRVSRTTTRPISRPLVPPPQPPLPPPSPQLVQPPALIAPVPPPSRPSAAGPGAALLFPQTTATHRAHSPQHKSSVLRLAGGLKSKIMSLSPKRKDGSSPSVASARLARSSRGKRIEEEEESPPQTSGTNRFRRYISSLLKGSRWSGFAPSEKRGPFQVPQASVLRNSQQSAPVYDEPRSSSEEDSSFSSFDSPSGSPQPWVGPKDHPLPDGPIYENISRDAFPSGSSDPRHRTAAERRPVAGPHSPVYDSPPVLTPAPEPAHGQSPIRKQQQRFSLRSGSVAALADPERRRGAAADPQGPTGEDPGPTEEDVIRRRRSTFDSRPGDVEKAAHIQPVTLGSRQTASEGSPTASDSILYETMASVHRRQPNSSAETGDRTSATRPRVPPSEKPPPLPAGVSRFSSSKNLFYQPAWSRTATRSTRVPPSQPLPPLPADGFLSDTSVESSSRASDLHGWQWQDPQPPPPIDTVEHIYEEVPCPDTQQGHRAASGDWRRSATGGERGRSPFGRP